MSSFYVKGCNKLYVAEILLKLFNASEDSLIQDVCFNLHQCAELFLKQICISKHIVQFNEVHNIHGLISVIATNGYNDEVLQDLDTYSDIITSWYTESRYFDTFYVNQRTVDKVVWLCHMLLDYTKRICELKDEPTKKVEDVYAT